jgi:uncharacterized membrane protein YdjX (TVP38/TMEM64 family)
MNARRALLLGLLVAALAAAAAGLPLHDWLASTLAWAAQHPRSARALFVLAYILAAVLVVPGSILTLGAGFLFGLPLGVALVSIGSLLGAAAAFLVGRLFARAWVAERIADLPRFRALDVATRYDGFMIVFLARLSPLFPYNLLNYGLGLTAVRFRDYFLATWLGMLPATVLFVYVGSLAKNLSALLNGDVDAGWATRILLVVGFVATVALTVLITRRATRTLQTRLRSEDEHVVTRTEGTE